MITENIRFGEARFALSRSILLQPPASTQDCKRVSALLEENFENFDSESRSRAIAPCPSCNYTGVSLVRMPDNCVHYAAKRCGRCDRFLKWEGKPETVNKKQQQQKTINQMLKASHLSQWERKFLEGLKSKKISPKQQEVLSRIEAKVGGAAK